MTPDACAMLSGMGKQSITKADAIGWRNAVLRPAIRAHKPERAVKAEYIEMPTWPLQQNADGSSTLYVSGAIVPEMIRSLFWEEYPYDVSSVQIAKLLSSEFHGQNLEVVINSPGGDFGEGAAIVSELEKLKKEGVKVSARVAGICGSAATFLLHAADETEISPLGRLFYHAPLAFIMNGAHAFALRDIADELDAIEASMLAFYQEKTGQSVEDLVKGKDGTGTWLTASEAIARGLVGGVAEDEEADPMAKEEKADPKAEDEKKEPAAEDEKEDPDAMDPDKDAGDDEKMKDEDDDTEIDADEHEKKADKEDDLHAGDDEKMKDEDDEPKPSASLEGLLKFSTFADGGRAKRKVSSVSRTQHEEEVLLGFGVGGQ